MDEINWIILDSIEKCILLCANKVPRGDQCLVDSRNKIFNIICPDPGPWRMATFHSVSGRVSVNKISSTRKHPSLLLVNIRTLCPPPLANISLHSLLPIQVSASGVTEFNSGR